MNQLIQAAIVVSGAEMKQSRRFGCPTRNLSRQESSSQVKTILRWLSNANRIHRTVSMRDGLWKQRWNLIGMRNRIGDSEYHDTVILKRACTL
jgi:hypothetical protein